MEHESQSEKRIGAMVEFGSNGNMVFVKKTRKPIKAYLIGVFLIALGTGIFFAAPFVYMLLMSLVKDSNAVLAYPPVFFSDHAYFNNYPEAWQYIDFFRKLLNTLIIMVANTSLSLTSSIMVAYGFARFENKVSNIFFMILLSTMMLPWVVTMIPAYAEFEFLGWIGTRLPLIIPAIGGSAFNVFMIRQFMVSIPKDLDEAAKIDGCNSFTILWRILVPQLKPVIATLLVYSFISGWSDYIGPSIYLQTVPEYYTLSLGMQQFFSATGAANWVQVMAASVTYTIPLVLVIALCQKAFVRGQVGAAIK